MKHENYIVTSTNEGTFLIVRCLGNKRIVYATLSQLWPDAQSKADSVAAGLNLLHDLQRGDKHETR